MHLEVFAVSDDHLKENTLSKSYLYRGRIINLRQDRVKLQSGKTALREVVEHPGAVAVLAVDEENKVVLVRQYRQPASQVLLEIPAGKLEPGEKPLDCARREFAEETSFEAESFQLIVSFYTSPGFCDELIHLFWARGLKKTAQSSTDPDEILEPVLLPLKEAAAKIATGTITDGKTIIALQHALLNS